MPDNKPPGLADRLLKFFCAPHRLEEVLGDLNEEFLYQVKQVGERRARWRYWWDVLGFIRPFSIKRQSNNYSTTTLKNPSMIRNYFKIAWRNLVHNKGYSAINIVGLSVGMAVAILIGLWVYDELSFNKYHRNYDRIAQVMVNGTNSSGPFTQWRTAPPFGKEIRNLYGSQFKHVLMAAQASQTILASGENKLMKTGYYFEPGVADMLTLKMRKGTRSGLKDKASILLAESVAKALFGDDDPMDKLVKIDNKLDVVVTGVYEDLPQNSDFNDMLFVAPWDLYVSNNSWLRQDDWRQNGFFTYVQLADQADLKKVSTQIKDVKLNRVNEEEAQFKPQLFLHPMNQWRLYSNFENGISHGGRIEFVWLYGCIGAFVLLLACINFMNLATARSEKRAKEVGIRKAVGSVRSQLIGQFFSESILVVAIGFALSILLAQLSLPFFNEVAGKKMALLWSNPAFWGIGIGFSLFTGLIAGSYPALYLSSFQPVKVLKGTFRAGRFASVPRQVLVVLQFTVSITLIIGVMIVFRQIQLGKNRPVGYNRNGLIMVGTPTADIHTHIDVVRDELKKSGAVEEIAESLNPMTTVSFGLNGYDWTGTGPNMEAGFGTVWIAPEFGKTIGWQFIDGRDFSKAYATDSLGMVLNETAVKFMGLKDPVGKTIKLTSFDKTTSFKVLGVIKDMLMESPYEPVRKTIYMVGTSKGNFVNIRINPELSTSAALSKIEAVFKKYNPAVPFDYKFVDDEYNRKFSDEEQIGKLASFFAVLAIFISCLGLFGMVSFMAEQRTKEIGVRKVLGASVINLWGLLSKDFLVLVIISAFISSPIAWYFLNDWLQRYENRTELSWWIFAAAGLGALLITLLTVSYQAIKASLVNPVKSLRSE